MITSLLLLSVFSLALPEDGGLARSGISGKDLSKLSKDIVEYFAALEVDDRSQQQESLKAIEEGMAKSAKRAKAGEPLTTYLGDFDLLLELAKPEQRSFKTSAGKGFFKHSFEEPSRDVSLGVMLSLPSDYIKSDELYPVIVALKPALGLAGAELEQRVSEMGSAMYGDLLETHVVLIPLGPDEPAGKRMESHELDVDWMSDEGLYSFYTGFRVLLEQVRFDRAHVVLDGWGEATLDAMRIATTSSFFSGLLLRSGEVGADDLIDENLKGVSVLYLDGAEDGGPADTAPLTDLSGKGYEIQVVEDPGSAMAPAAETQATVKEWLGRVRKDLAPASIEYRLGDIRFQARGWCKAAVINRRVTAKPEDPDFPRFSARIDRGRNRVEIQSVNVLEMEVYLSDALLDMSKPVTFVVNGEVKLTHKPRPSLRDLLENRFYNNSQDYGLYTDHVLVEDIPANVPGRG